MALPQGINFRASSGYVTDSANHDYELAGTYGNYPRTTAQGNSVGWESGGGYVDSRNRNSGVDARLAGCNIAGAGAGQCIYRIDLPSSGSYVVRFAAGDANYVCDVAWDLADTTTQLRVLSTGSTSAGGRFNDATDTEYTSANWPGSNSSVTDSYSSTILRVRTTAAADQRIAHLYVESAGGATGHPTMKRWAGVPGMSQTNSIGRGW